MSGTVNKIAVINLTRMGDVLMTGPLLDRLREMYPGREIHLLATSGYAPVAEGMGWDRVVPVDYNVLTTLAVEAAKKADRLPMVSILRDFRKTLQPLLEVSYEAIYNVSHTDVTSVLSWLMKGPVLGGLTLDKQGYRAIPNTWARYFFAGNLNRHLNPFHLVDVMVGTGDGLGGRTKRSVMRYAVPDEATACFRALEAEMGLQNTTGPRIVMQCGASEHNKRWEPEKFGEVGRRLREQTGAHVLFVGTRSEIPLAEEAMEAMGEGSTLLAGQTNIPVLAAWLKSADLLVTNDTGTMHLAQAVGSRSLVITLCSALSDETGPYGDGNLIVEPNVSCFPCSFHVTCPHLDCHKAITVDDITTLSLDMLHDRVKERYEPGELTLGVVLWRSGFDEDNWWKKQPLTRIPVSRDRVVRETFRELWKTRFEPGIRPDGFHVNHLARTLFEAYGPCPPDLLQRFLNRDIPAVRGIAEKGRIGQSLAVELEELSTDVQRNHARMQQVGRAIADLDRQLEDTLLANDLWRPLMLLFHFEAGNLTPNDLAVQSRETEQIYRNLALNADGAADLLEQLLPAWRELEAGTISESAMPPVEPETRPVPKAEASLTGASALKRPRMRGERLHILFPRETYFIQQELIDAFRRLGHKVTELRYENNPNFIRELLEASLSADLLVTINHLGFDSEGELANLLDQIELPYASWYVDRPGFILLNHEVGPTERAFLFTWERATLAEIEAYGFEHVEFLPLATDPARFTPGNDGGRGEVRWIVNSMLSPTQEWKKKAGLNGGHDPLYEKAIEIQLAGRVESTVALEIAATALDADLSHWDGLQRWTYASAVALGATLQMRRRLAMECRRSDLVLYGDEGWRLLAPNITWEGPVSYPDGLPAVYRGGIHLNVTSFQMPTAVNQRVFDIPACGGVLLTDDQEDLGELFDHDRECLTFDHPEEAANKLQYLKDHPEFGRRVTAKARERIQKAHTYDRRAKTILERVRRVVGRSVVSLQGGEAW